MFLGQQKNRLDNKGRVAVPAKFRNELGETVVINRYLDGCLAIYTSESWKSQYDRIMQLPSNRSEIRKYQRSMTSLASEVTFDAQGRIMIPEPLRNLVRLSKDCIFIGAGDHVELWPEEQWNAYNSGLTEEEIESISENLL